MTDDTARPRADDLPDGSSSDGSSSTGENPDTTSGGSPEEPDESVDGE